MSFNIENNSEEYELPSELNSPYSYNEYFPFKENLFNFPGNLNFDLIPNNLTDSNLRGRKRAKSKQSKNIHDKYRTDNMFSKVHGHFISFITEYVNSILEILDYEDKFIKVNYKYKTRINKEYFTILKNSNIGEILIQDVSPKFKLQSKNYNKIIYEKVINNPIISKLLSQNYLNLFKTIYYKSERNINLENYGLNININLPKNKVKMYKDLLEKKNNKKSPEYITELNEFVKKRFINNL